MQRLVLPTPHAHAELQALKAIQPSHALLVDPPALAAEQDPDAQESETWPCVGPAPGCADAGPSDPWLDSSDTRPRD